MKFATVFALVATAQAAASAIVATPSINTNTEALSAVKLGKRQDIGGVVTETQGSGIHSCGSYKEGEQGEGDNSALGCDDPPPPEGVPANGSDPTTAQPNNPQPTPTPAPANPNDGQNGQNGNSNGQGNQQQGQGTNNGGRPDRDGRPNRGGREDERPRPRPRPRPVNRPRPQPQPQQQQYGGGGLLGLNIGGGRGGLLGGGGLLGTGLVLRRDAPSAKYYHMMKAAGY